MGDRRPPGKESLAKRMRTWGKQGIETSSLHITAPVTTINRASGSRDPLPLSSQPRLQPQQGASSAGHVHVSRPPPPRVRATTPSSVSDFSLHSSYEHRAFREDNGRIFQASNDDYVLPAGKPFIDEIEKQRLEVQHRGLKVRLGGKNYAAPIDQVLRDGGQGQRVLDVGTGTGIWAMEIAREFPLAEVVGLDLAPVQRDQGVPDNCSFRIDDATKGIPFPDGYFDVIHTRFLIAGVRDWPGFLNEIIRVARPGGMVVHVECIARFWIDDTSERSQKQLIPGVIAWCDKAEVALDNRGLDPIAAATTIPTLLRGHSGVREVQTRYISLPMWPWSNDPVLKRVGEILRPDAHGILESGRLLIVDGASVSQQEYDKLVAGFKADMGQPGANLVLPCWHHWAFKKA